MRLLPLAFVMACTSETDALVFPDVQALPALVEAPDALTNWAGGEPVTTPEDWHDVRGPEIDALFDHYIYGASPGGSASNITALETIGVRSGDLMQFTADHPRGDMLLSLWVPRGGGPHPVILGLNKCGNHTVFDDAAVLNQGGYQDPTCVNATGSRRSYWDIEAVTAAGYAVATVHQSDFAPDDRDSLLASPAIAAWAHGLQVAVDVLESTDVVGDITVFGHSRRGKAALLAASRDERIDAVWAHQSGTLGAALTRSFEGESIEAITTFFPHWFDERAAEFADDPTQMPVDQHLLIARIAPRPVLLTDGDDDAWANPAGAQQAAQLAEPVFELLDGPAPTWISRPGGHEVLPSDWDIVVGFLDDMP